MKRAGFTLTELIVVVSITALLMAVLLPVLRGSRQQAKSVLCSSNIKQLLAGLTMYETDNRTLPHAFHFKRVPPPGGYPGNQMLDSQGWWWFNYTTDHRRKDETNVLWCPANKITNIHLKNYILHGNYGVNQSMCKLAKPNIYLDDDDFNGTPLRTSDIRQPAGTLLLVDCGYSMINWWHAADSPPEALGNTRIEDTAYIPGLRINSARQLWPGQEDDAVNGRHPRKTVNVGFASGHVERRDADDLLVKKTANSYKNISPLWSQSKTTIQD
ncbi:MAG: prepilin-type N-terminal cleavage/methylation domain-containing protein [Planctomycetota bacterium]|nr:MAG: prepilin-type N-terminal cleavage/methylation domain-containing protein [Planctomycetota bacterium]